MISINRFFRVGFCLLVLFVTTQAFGIETPKWENFTCQSAFNACEGQGREGVFRREFNAPQGMCIGGKTKLYFYFKSGQTLNAQVIAQVNGSGTSSSSRVYGPFDDLTDACQVIEQNSAQSNVQSNPAPGSLASNYPISASIQLGRYYVVEITMQACSGTLDFYLMGKMGDCNQSILCTDCIGKFQPKEKQFVISAWVKEDNAAAGTTTYANAFLRVLIGGQGVDFHPQGQIIDGWQRIEGVFTASAIGDIELQLRTLSGEAYFDDIRIFPFDGSMMSYVYDPVSLRLMAELDERNYAKLYEYDEEGKLIRVKKETEKGIMTIQENRDSNAKE